MMRDVNKMVNRRRERDAKMTFRGNWPCPSPRCHHVPNPCIFSPARPPSYTVNTTIYPAIHAHTIDNRWTPCPPALGRPAQDHLRSLDPSCKVWRSRHPHLRTGCAPRLAANGPLHPSSAHQPGQGQPHTQTPTQRQRKNIPSGSMETAALPRRRPANLRAPRRRARRLLPRCVPQPTT